MEVEKRAHSRSRRENRRGENQSSCGTRSSPRKRSYQREQRRGSNSTEHPLSNDDLRSPCHKQPRFKGQKENTPNNKIDDDKKGPWNQKHDEKEKQKVELDNKDFPPLGFYLDRYTPESSKDWGATVQEEEYLDKCKENNRKPSKIKRRLMLSDTSDPTPKESTDDKSKAKNKVLRPMIKDPHKLQQRQKQIDIGKNTVSYGRYFNDVSRESRSKDDPWTPDKFQQCSTRSWVGQIKVWRRRLHSYDPDSHTKEDLFSTSSTSSSQNTDEIRMEEQEKQPKSEFNSIEEMFKDFDLDSCLKEDDGLPL